MAKYYRWLSCFPARVRDPYIEASCQCAKCKEWWTVRQRGSEVCLDYYPPRTGHDSYSLSETALYGAYCGKTGSK